MKIQKLAALLLTIPLSLAASQSAVANPNSTPTCDLAKRDHNAHGCLVELLAVFDVIGGAMSVSAKDEPKLQSKVCAADDKLEVTPSPKTADAIKKLENIIVTVNSKAKIVDTDAAEIAAEAVLAQLCIGEL